MKRSPFSWSSASRRLPSGDFPHPNATSAVTLVEVLLVLAVLLIISGLSIPTFTRIIKKSKQTTSLANLRGISQAIIQSTIDSDGKYPQMRNYAWEGPQHSGQEFPWMQDSLAPYLNLPDKPENIPVIFRNPLILANKNPGWLQARGQTHYRYNIFNAPARMPVRSSRAVLLFDVVWPDWPAEDFPIRSDTANPAILVTYADGHVAEMDRETYKTLNPHSGESASDPFFTEGWIPK